MSLASAAASRLEQLATGDEELRPYVEMLAIALEAAAEPWPAPVALRAHPGEPLLHSAQLALPRQNVTRLYVRLSSAAGRDAGAVDLQRLADALSLRDGDPVLQLTLLPLLQSAAASAEPPASWPLGVCPVCAAWPAIAESRGLERTRVLRCGRCASGWQLPWQLCPFCGNDDHAGLSYLIGEELGEARRIFACERCKGYLKTLATLGPIEQVPVEDLATLELDLAAVDAGFSRPAAPGFDLEVELSWQS